MYHFIKSQHLVPLELKGVKLFVFNVLMVDQ